MDTAGVAIDVLDGAIKGRHISNSVITSEHIANNSISANKLNTYDNFA